MYTSRVTRTRTWTVYALLSSQPLTVCYVGATTQPLYVRLREHIRTRGWRERPIIIPIETVKGTRKEAERRERWWVWFYLAMGHDLLNKKHTPHDRQAFIQYLRSTWLVGMFELTEDDSAATLYPRQPLFEASGMRRQCSAIVAGSI